MGETEHAAVPHLFPSGPGLTAPGGHPIPFVRALIPWPFSSFVISRQPIAATVDEAKSQVSLIHGRHHPPLFKIFFDAIPKGAPHLSRAVLESTVKAARELGMRPVVHIGSSADMVTDAEVGVALLMHPPSSDLLTDEQVATLAKIGTPFVTTMRTYSAVQQVPLPLSLIPLCDLVVSLPVKGLTCYWCAVTRSLTCTRYLRSKKCGYPGCVCIDSR